MTPFERILDHLAEAIEADIDSGDEALEIDRAAVMQLREPSGQPQAETVMKPMPAVKAIEPAIKSSAGRDNLEIIAAEARACTKCALHKTRTNAVPGQGNSAPEIMFIGEAPGADEDEQGLAFVGRAGQLLTKMIEAMGFTREQVFIGNILKCRPPNNRVPMPDEMAVCLPYLLRQIKVLKPKVIVALGATAVKGLLKTETGITRLRGKWQEFEGVPLMPTLHPAYLLRNPKAKHDAWADLKEVLGKLGRKVPPSSKSS